tara:strand:+ start:80 stop:274 length:195 start_codon:yes stop_codon:yes gene_type:complete
MVLGGGDVSQSSASSNVPGGAEDNISSIDSRVWRESIHRLALKYPIDVAMYCVVKLYKSQVDYF